MSSVIFFRVGFFALPMGLYLAPVSREAQAQAQGNRALANMKPSRVAVLRELMKKYRYPDDVLVGEPLLVLLFKSQSRAQAQGAAQQYALKNRLSSDKAKQFGMAAAASWRELVDYNLLEPINDPNLRSLRIVNAMAGIQASSFSGSSDPAKGSGKKGLDLGTVDPDFKAGQTAKLEDWNTPDAPVAPGASPTSQASAPSNSQQILSGSNESGGTVGEIRIVQGGSGANPSNSANIRSASRLSPDSAANGRQALLLAPSAGSFSGHVSDHAAAAPAAVQSVAKSLPQVQQAPVSASDAQNAYAMWKYWATMTQNLSAQGSGANAAALAHAQANATRYAQVVEHAPPSVRPSLKLDPASIQFDEKTDCGPHGQDGTPLNKELSGGDLFKLFEEAANRGANLSTYSYQNSSTAKSGEHSAYAYMKQQRQEFDTNKRSEGSRAYTYTFGKANVVPVMNQCLAAKALTAEARGQCETVASIAFLNSSTRVLNGKVVYKDPALQCHGPDNQLGPAYVKIEKSLRNYAIKCGSREALVLETMDTMLIPSQKSQDRSREFTERLKKKHGINVAVPPSIPIDLAMQKFFGGSLKVTNEKLSCDKLNNAYSYISRMVTHSEFPKDNFPNSSQDYDAGHSDYNGIKQHF